MLIQGIIRAIVKQERQGHDDLSNTKINFLSQNCSVAWYESKLWVRGEPTPLLDMANPQTSFASVGSETPCFSSMTVVGPVISTIHMIQLYCFPKSEQYHLILKWLGATAVLEDAAWILCPSLPLPVEFSLHLCCSPFLPHALCAAKAWMPSSFLQLFPPFSCAKERKPNGLHL